MFYVIRFLVVYPVFVFFWFCVMTGLLYVLSKNQTLDTVMLVGMGVVGAIRVSSYYTEALSTDIAKILPFALLGTMIVDSSVTRIFESTEGVQDAALSWETAVYYLVAVVALESVLRLVTGIIHLLRRGAVSDDLQESAETAQPESAAPQKGREVLQTSPESPVPSPVAAAAAPGPNGRTVIPRGHNQLPDRRDRQQAVAARRAPCRTGFRHTRNSATNTTGRARTLRRSEP